MQNKKKVSSHLSKALKEKHNRRSLGVRKGDKVRVMRGSYKGKEAKVEKVVNNRVMLEGIKRKKTDGKEANVFFSPEKLMITELNTSDSWRAKILKRSEK